jgi:hypothetical protein
MDTNDSVQTGNIKRVYNTEKDKLIIREYGRNTQNLINQAKTIVDLEERQAYVEKIVQLIMSMHPYTRNIDDYRLKVWSHVLMMADYDLNIVVPENLPDARLKNKPEKVHYPKKTRRLRHYGQNVKIMIDKAKEMEDPEQKQAYIAIIGSYMKMSYKAWNRESVTDDVIFMEFAKIANGELTIPEGTNIDSLILPRQKKLGGNTSNDRAKRSGKNLKNTSNKNSAYKKNTKPKNSKTRNSNSSNNSNNKNRNKKR